MRNCFHFQVMLKNFFSLGDDRKEERSELIKIKVMKGVGVFW